MSLSQGSELPSLHRSKVFLGIPSLLEVSARFSLFSSIHLGSRDGMMVRGACFRLPAIGRASLRSFHSLSSLASVWGPNLGKKIRA